MPSRPASVPGAAKNEWARLIGAGARRFQANSLVYFALRFIQIGVLGDPVVYLNGTGVNSSRSFRTSFDKTVTTVTTVNRWIPLEGGMIDNRDGRSLTDCQRQRDNRHGLALSACSG